MFSGTIRSNLDIAGEYTDAQLWAALEQVNLRAAVEAKAPALVWLDIADAFLEGGAPGAADEAILALTACCGLACLLDRVRGRGGGNSNSKKVAPDGDGAHNKRGAWAQLDVANAFPSVRRRAVLEVVAEHAPLLLPLAEPVVFESDGVRSSLLSRTPYYAIERLDAAMSGTCTIAM